MTPTIINKRLAALEAARVAFPLRLTPEERQEAAQRYETTLYEDDPMPPEAAAYFSTATLHQLASDYDAMLKGRSGAVGVIAVNITTLRQRLEKLEAQSASHAAPQPLHPLTKLLNVLVAHHLGGAGPNESIAEATARGLGYDGSCDFKAALQAQSDTTAAEDRDTRWCDAMHRLFALKGTTPDCDGPTFGATLVALFTDLPERLQHHPFFSPADRLPEAVYDFLL